MSYPVIYVDPSWGFKNYSAKGELKNPNQHYGCLPVEAIAAFPVGQLAAPDCAMFMWVTGPFMEAAFTLGAAWGFKYVTDAFTWVKRSEAGRYAFGCGYWTRKNTEKVLLFTRGKPKRLSGGVAELVVSPRGGHSEKPEEVAARIERLVAGPYIELFARRERAGWTCIGNELTGNDLAVDIQRLASQRSLPLETTP